MVKSADEIITVQTGMKGHHIKPDYVLWLKDLFITEQRSTTLANWSTCSAIVPLEGGWRPGMLHQPHLEYWPSSTKYLMALLIPLELYLITICSCSLVKERTCESLARDLASKSFVVLLGKHSAKLGLLVLGPLTIAKVWRR